MGPKHTPLNRRRLLAGAATLAVGTGVGRQIRGAATGAVTMRIKDVRPAFRDHRLPGLFRITDGSLHTACLADLPGLGTAGPA